MVVGGLLTSAVLSRLAAVALLVLQSEEEAFWCLVAIVETIMPQDYYTQKLLASQVSELTGPAGHMTRRLLPGHT